MAPTNNTQNVPLTNSVINNHVQLCLFKIETSLSDEWDNVTYVFHNSITCMKIQNGDSIGENPHVEASNNLV